MLRRPWFALVALIAGLLLAGSGLVAQSGVALNESLAGRQVFPEDNWWNLDVSTAPVAAESQSLIDWISG